MLWKHTAKYFISHNEGESKGRTTQPKANNNERNCGASIKKNTKGECNSFVISVGSLAWSNYCDGYAAKFKVLITANSNLLLNDKWQIYYGPSCLTHLDVNIRQGQLIYYLILTHIFIKPKRSSVCSENKRTDLTVVIILEGTVCRAGWICTTLLIIMQVFQPRCSENIYD